jgi:hypothetical protein
VSRIWGEAVWGHIPLPNCQVFFAICGGNSI